MRPCYPLCWQVLRVIPYSAAQLYSYELFKRCFQDRKGELSVQRRMAAGACAGMASTLVSPKCLRKNKFDLGSRLLQKCY